MDQIKSTPAPSDNYPLLRREDSFENMKRFAKAHDFPFPYLHDETQTVARAYGAACTPDFFGYNADRKLKYRGRLDEGRTTPPRAGTSRKLVEAMRAIATTGVAPAHQKLSVGCSIKWNGRIKPSPSRGYQVRYIANLTRQRPERPRCARRRKSSTSTACSIRAF
jgi:hypothetical protein